jgi:hypothetical protein
VIAIIHLIQIIGIAVELFAFLLLVVFLRLRRRRREDDEDQLYHEPVRVPWAVRLLMYVMPLLVWGVTIYALSRANLSQQMSAPEPAIIPPPPPSRNEFIEQVRASLGLAWWELLIAAALAVLALIAIARALREPPPAAARVEEETSSHTRALATAVTAGLRDARLEPDPRRAVIAAYATMEQLLAAQGLPRRAVEAPLEYLARLFAELEGSREAMRTLTDLFELARFSHHVITHDAKARAIAALTTIEQELQETR